VEKAVLEGIEGATAERMIVSDSAEEITGALERSAEFDVILTTGGTGLGPRDITPDVTEKFCDRLVPGIAEYLRAGSIRQTVNASLSRAVAGQKGRTLVVNLPGSVKGASFCAELLVPVLVHAFGMAWGEGH
jgi:molybdopterin adenylyltransferase